MNETGEIVGGVSRSGIAVTYDGEYLGKVGANGIVQSAALLPVGCVGTYGDVFNKDGGYMGKVLENRYAYDLSGNFLNVVGENGKVSIPGGGEAKLYANNLVADDANRIIGVALDEKSIVVDPSGKFMGRVFPDGNVYNDKGVALGKIHGRGTGFFNRMLGKLLPRGEVVDFYGKKVGKVN